MLKVMMIRGWMWFVIFGVMGCAHAPQNAPTADSRYVIQGETVYDKKTDLTWQRCSVGQRWVEGTQCVGVIKTFTFDDVQQQGGEMWRVPTKDELATLIGQNRKTNKQKPTIDEVAFPDMNLENLAYWSRTPNGASVAWDVFLIGNTDAFRGITFAVRLVRGGQ